MISLGEMVFDIEFNQSDIGVIMAARQGVRLLLSRDEELTNERREHAQALAHKIDEARSKSSYLSLNNHEVGEALMAIDENAAYECDQSKLHTGHSSLFSGMAKVAEMRRAELVEFVYSVHDI